MKGCAARGRAFSWPPLIEGGGVEEIADGIVEYSIQEDFGCASNLGPAVKSMGGGGRLKLSIGRIWIARC